MPGLLTPKIVAWEVALAYVEVLTRHLRCKLGLAGKVPPESQLVLLSGWRHGVVCLAGTSQSFRRVRRRIELRVDLEGDAEAELDDCCAVAVDRI